jgi:hypothetical protein
MAEPGATRGERKLNLKPQMAQMAQMKDKERNLQMPGMICDICAICG